MSDKTIEVKVFRFDPAKDAEPYYQTYDVPLKPGMSIMDALDYIYQNLDGTLAYYDHAGCALGICGKCTARINNKPGLLCQTPLTDSVEIDPLNKDKVLKDLVPAKSEAKTDDIDQEEVEMTDINSVPIILRREIEALMAVPLIKGYINAMGRKKALEVAEQVVKNLAMESGKMMVAFVGGNTMEHLQKALPMFSMGGALEFDVVETSATKAGINVTRCKYAEMYKEHGLEDFGFMLSCGRDFALMEGFNPDLKFTRTQTIMEGAEYCDFRFEVEK
jgi:fumarate reductase iron-sulfur subunit